MRWPWSKRPKPEHTAAVQQAQERLDDVRSMDAEVNSLADRLRDIRDNNNFAAMLASAFKDHR